MQQPRWRSLMRAPQALLIAPAQLAVCRSMRLSAHRPTVPKRPPPKLARPGRKPYMIPES